jgi:regulator of sigma E protease
MNSYISFFDPLLTILSALMVLGVVITIHELGHFLFAKMFGIGVIEFAIGFGRPIFRHKYGETWYALRLIPLGGFVKMAGEDRRLLNPEISEEDKKELEPNFTEWGDESRWFLKKPFLQKVLVVVAGPLFNLLFAAVLITVALTTYGAVVDIVDEPVIGSVAKDFSADKAGIKPGDRVISVGDAPVNDWQELSKRVLSYKGEKFKIKIQRESENQVQELELELSGKKLDPEIAAITGEDSSEYRIGIGAMIKREPVPIFTALKAGVTQTVALSWMTLKSLYGLAVGVLSPKNIRGPIFIFQKAGEVAKEGFEPLINFTVLINISLAIFNLLPIPILDGGHLVIFATEAVLRNSLSDKVLLWAANFGVIILLSITFLALSNDILDLVY